MAKDFEFKGVWIPGKVFTDARLTQSDKFLFGLIYILTNERGCFATRETLASYMGQSVRNTQYSISRLLDCGYVRRDADGVLWDVISHTIDRGEKSFTTPVKNPSPEGCKNLHPDSNKVKGIDDSEALVSDSFIRSNQELSALWDKWVAYRRSKRWSTTNDYVSRWNEELSKHGVAKSITAINESLLQGWQGLFPGKSMGQARSAPPKTSKDHAEGF